MRSSFQGFTALLVTLLASLFFVTPSVNAQEAQIIQLTSEQLYEKHMAGEFDLLIDVRSQAEWDAGHIVDATFVKDLQITLREASADTYEATLEELNLWNCRHCKVAVYCAGGVRARAAIDLLVEAGFTGELYNGLGVNQWTAAGYELVQTESNERRPCLNVDTSAVGVVRQDGDVCSAPTATVIKFDTAQDFHDMWIASEFDVVIDVRTQEEWDAGHIEGATFVENLQIVLAETDDYEATLTSLNLWGCRYCRMAVYCRSGNRSGQAIERLVEAGFTGPLYNGLGVSQWTEAGYPLVNGNSVDDKACMTVEEPAAITAQSRACAATPAQSPDGGTFITVAESTNSEAYYELIHTEMQTNRDLFLAQMEMHNSTTYAFNFTLSCFCPPADYPWVVTAEIQHLMMGVKPNLTAEFKPDMLASPVQVVVADVVQSALTSVGQDVVQMEDTYLKYFSILDLFEKIQDAIDQKAAEINVVYNSDWGYPEEIFIDYKQIMADDELMVTVSNMTVVDTSMEMDDGFEMDTNTSQIDVDVDAGDAGGDKM